MYIDPTLRAARMASAGRRVGKVFMLWWCMKMQGDEYSPASALCLMYDTLVSLHVSYIR